MKRTRTAAAWAKWAVVNRQGTIQRYADGIPGVSLGTHMLYVRRKEAVNQAHVMEDCHAMCLTGKVGKGRKRA